MDLRVVIPVNRLDRAKGRLAELLSPAEREQLALATLSTVLRAVDEAGLPATVLTSEAELTSRLAAPATVVQESPDASGLNGQLERLLSGMRGTNVLILHADLPLADAAAIRAMVAASPPAPSCTLVRSGDGGTNAMLLRPCGGFSLAYGAGSFAKHEAAAQAAGYAVRSVESQALALDLDTPADLRTLLSSDPGRLSEAGRLLSAMNVVSRLSP